MSNETDRELLELAAKAIRIRYIFPANQQVALWTEERFTEHGSGYWNPLADDGDALRLAETLKLNMAMEFCRGNDGPELTKKCCRAIVQAAAEIGKAMP